MAGQVPPTSGMIIFTVSASTLPTACEGPGSNGGQNNVCSHSPGDFLLPPMISSLSHLTPLAGQLTLLPFPLYFSALVAALGKQTLQKTKCDNALHPSMGWRHLTSPLLYQCAVHSPALPFLPSLSPRAAFFLVTSATTYPTTTTASSALSAPTRRVCARMDTQVSCHGRDANRIAQLHLIIVLLL